MPLRRSSVCSSRALNGHLKKCFSPRLARRCVLHQPRPISDVTPPAPRLSLMPSQIAPAQQGMSDCHLTWRPRKRRMVKPGLSASPPWTAPRASSSAPSRPEAAAKAKWAGGKLRFASMLLRSQTDGLGIRREMQLGDAQKEHPNGGIYIARGETESSRIWPSVSVGRPIST